MQYQYRAYDVTPGGYSAATSGGIPSPPPNAFVFFAPVRRSSSDDDDLGQAIDENQGIHDIDGIGHQPSGVRVTLTDDEITDAPDDADPGDPGHPSKVAKLDPAQSAIGMHDVPWAAEQPGGVPPSRTTPFSQKWGGKAVIGRQTPFDAPPD